MSKLTITEEVNKIVKRSIGREIVLNIGNGRTLELYKHTNADDSAEDYDSGYEWRGGQSRELFNSLSESEQEEIDDFINNLEM